MELFNVLKNGSIVLANSLPSSSIDTYSITVQAIDMPDNIQTQRYVKYIFLKLVFYRKSTANVEIFIDRSLSDETTTINTLATLFINLPNSIDVSESMPPQSRLFKIKSQVPDADGKRSYRIIGGNMARNFALNGSWIVIAKELDAEQLTSYSLLIQVKSMTYGTVANATLDINVEDANDNVPVFEQVWHRLDDL